MRAASALSLATLAAIACSYLLVNPTPSSAAATKATTSPTPAATPAPASADTLKFGAIGDWGLSDPMINSNVADSLAEQCASCAFVLLLGDNFYDYGVRNVRDAQFKRKYLQVFTHPNFKSMPFFVIAGNHDHYGSVAAQIQYTKKDPTKRWTFPSLYYTRQVQQNNVKLLLVMLDTWSLVGGDTLVRVDRRTGARKIKSRAALRSAVERGKLSPDSATEMANSMGFAEDADAETSASPPRRAAAFMDMRQYAWLERVLVSVEANASDWVIVAGHYAIRSASVGEHGDTPDLVQTLDPILRAHPRVQLYLNGHDHVLQHIYRGGVLHYVGSGAGAVTHTAMNTKYEGLRGYASGAYGFTTHQVDAKAKTLTTRLFSMVGNSNPVAKLANEFVQKQQQ